MNYEERDTYGMYKTRAAVADIDKANTGGGIGPDMAHGPGPALMGADTLIGNEVVNRQADSLGDIKEIMLDLRSGRVAYAVLSVSGFLGLGEKLFAVPWQALTLDTMNKRFVLDVDKEHLKAEQGFDKDHWPDMADPEWAANLHSHYGTRMYTVEAGSRS